jgi:PAS domain S-box-containing protein
MKNRNGRHPVKPQDRRGSQVALSEVDLARSSKQFWESPSDYCRLFEENPLPMLVFELETLSFLAVNQAAIHYYGYSREEFLAMTEKDICAPDEMPFLPSALSQTNHLETSGKRRHKKRDGTIIKVEVLGHSLIFEGMSARLLIASDATRSAQTDEAVECALKEMNDIRFALDASSIVAITDRRGIINYVNDKFCAISKYSRGELLGQDHRLINSGHHSKEFIRGLWETIAQGKVWRGEIKNRAKDGSHYWVDTTIVPFLGADRKPYQYVSIRNDITEYKQAEEALFQMQAQRAHDEKITELGRVAAQVAHEVRNPLAGLLLYSSHLKSKVVDKLPAGELQVIDKIIDTINQLTATTEQILNFARPIKLLYQQVNLSRIICDVLQLLKSQIATNRIVLSLNLGEATLAGMINEPSIRATLLNLILNSIQAMPDGGCLTIAIRAVDRNVSVTVSDTGCGMTAEQAEGVFEPFNSTKSRGLGLGMPYAKKIIEQHGGKISVTSRLGEGTNIEVELPATKEGKSE